MVQGIQHKLWFAGGCCHEVHVIGPNVSSKQGPCKLSIRSYTLMRETTRFSRADSCRRPPGCTPNFYLKFNAGRTVVPSCWTASRLLGSSPKAWSIVGATCVVSTKVVTLRGAKSGFDTSIITLVSSCAKPPCSACFLEL